MSSGKGNEELKYIFWSLVDYTKQHFKHEEDIFNRRKYRETATHIAEHTVFTKNVIGLYEQFKAGKVGLPIEVKQFLK